MDVLNRICTDKVAHIEAQKAKIPLKKLQNMIQEKQSKYCFSNKILDFKKNNDIALITEIKKASPSRGLIRDNFDPVEIAKTYESSGAACISVLTDTTYFQGKDTDLIDVRKTVNVPLLRKDFMLDIYQVYEAAMLGADCILIIMAALDDTTAQDLYDCATDLGLDALFEVHDEQELERALKLSPKMVGVNNRNLKTLEISLDTGCHLASLLPNNIIKIAESGIHTHEDLQRMRSNGFDAFLIGEIFMKQDNIAAAIDKILNRTS